MRSHFKWFFTLYDFGRMDALLTIFYMQPFSRILFIYYHQLAHEFVKINTNEIWSEDVCGECYACRWIYEVECEKNEWLNGNATYLVLAVGCTPQCLHNFFIFAVAVFVTKWMPRQSCWTHWYADFISQPLIHRVACSHTIIAHARTHKYRKHQ